MEDRRRQHGVGLAFHEPVVEVLERAGAAGGDDGDVHRPRQGARELEVVAVLRTVAVHAGEEDLAGAEGHGLASPRYSVAAGRTATAMRVYLPCCRRGGREAGSRRGWADL